MKTIFSIFVIAVLSFLLISSLIITFDLVEQKTMAMASPPSTVPQNQHAIDARKAERRKAANEAIASGQMKPLKSAEAMPVTKTDSTSTPVHTFKAPQEIAQIPVICDANAHVYRIVDNDNTVYVTTSYDGYGRTKIAIAVIKN
jgi:hypothetical protein